VRAFIAGRTASLIVASVGSVLSEHPVPVFPVLDVVSTAHWVSSSGKRRNFLNYADGEYDVMRTTEVTTMMVSKMTSTKQRGECDGKHRTFRTPMVT